MQKYTVKFYVVDYREKEIDVYAESKQEALKIAGGKSDDGEGDFTMIGWKTWKKPTIKRV